MISRLAVFALVLGLLSLSFSGSSTPASASPLSATVSLPASVLGQATATEEGKDALEEEVEKADSGEESAEAKADEEEAKDPEQEKLEEMKQEIQRLQTEYELLQQRQKNDLLEAELEKQRIQTQASLEKARQEQELAALRQQLSNLQTESELREALKQKEISQTQAEIERRNLARKKAELDVQDEIAKLQTQAQRMAAETALRQEEANRHSAEIAAIKQEYAAELAKIRSKLEVRSTKDEARTKVLEDIDYLAEPLQDDTLYVSDRRISLNGPIFTGVADYVTDRIHYYNNQSKELPIFLVIDRCPGGSVMEGYRIVKAIDTSPAPVHVVVKSYAASMAAVITTLADHSYCYPNAVILHHEMSSGMYGNITEMSEHLENAREWERRLAVPVAEKMGVTLDRFREMMYENNSNGDWEEFGDGAKELKWVNNIVHEIREDGVRDQPTDDPFSGFWFLFLKEHEQVDSEGKRFIRLPRLQPFDHYFIYNPDRYYRL